MIDETTNGNAEAVVYVPHDSALQKPDDGLRYCGLPPKPADPNATWNMVQRIYGLKVLSVTAVDDGQRRGHNCTVSGKAEDIKRFNEASKRKSW